MLSNKKNGRRSMGPVALFRRMSERHSKKEVAVFMTTGIILTKYEGANHIG